MFLRTCHTSWLNRANSSKVSIVVNFPSFELIMHGLVFLVLIRLRMLGKFAQVLVYFMDQLVPSIWWIDLWRLENPIVTLVHVVVGVGLVGVCCGCWTSDVFSLVSSSLPCVPCFAFQVLLWVQMVTEQRLLSRDARRANLAICAFRVLFMVAEDSIRYVLLWFIVEKAVLGHYLLLQRTIAGHICLCNLWNSLARIILHLLLLLFMLIVCNQLLWIILFLIWLLILISVNLRVEFHLIWGPNTVTVIIIWKWRVAASLNQSFLL